MTARLSVSRLTHVYGDRAVLRDISFAAAPGEILCLLGRSGSGKTTLLRLIAGLESPREGSIHLDGRALTGKGFVPPEKRGIGLMFQDYALFPHLTALDNVRFAAKAGDPDPLALLARVRLSEAADRHPHTLSAGEQQRVALVRALASRPSVLLMDEPFSNLDAGTREQIREMTLALLKETGTTAVIVTHDSAEAMMIADRIILLNGGRIEQADTPERMYRKPASFYAARYFSDLNAVGRPGAYVRTHDLRLGAPDTGRLAKVASVSYRGENTIVTVVLDGAPVKADIRGQVAFSPGQDVGISFADEDLMNFQDNPFNAEEYPHVVPSREA